MANGARTDDPSVAPHGAALDIVKNYKGYIVNIVKRFILSAVALLSLSASASELNVESEVLSSYCTEYFGLVNVTFENESSKWINVQSVTISFGSPELDKKVGIVAGENLVSWNDSIATKLQSDAFYSRLLLGTIGAVGSTIANQKGSDIAGAVALGSAGVLTLAELGSIKERLELGQVLPRTHLLSGEFSIPPGLSTSRWILFNTNENDGLPFLTEFDMNLFIVGDKMRTEKLKFRIIDSSCSWQSKSRPKSSNHYQR